MRIMLALLATAGLFAKPALSEPVTEWTLETGMGLEGTPVPYPSAKPDGILIAMGGRVLRVDGRGKLVFDTSFGPDKSRGGIAEVCAADLDGDGREELVTTHKDGVVCALSGEGKVLWDYNLGEALGTWQMANTADLDNDGKPEILVSDMAGWITCITPDGKMRWRSKMERDVWEVSTPAVGDIDADGRPEIVYGTQTRYVVALDADGRFEWERFLPPLHLGRTMPLIADNDGDGVAEIYVMSSMLAADGGVACLNGPDGSLRWTGPTDTNVYHGRCLARFEDGTRGIIVGDKANCLSAFQADGKRRWRVDLSGRGIWQPPAVADFDGDGRDELVVTIRDRATDGSGHSWYVLNASTGETVAAYAGEDGFGGPCVADIDGDGALEVVITSRKGKVTAYGSGVAAKPDAVYSGSWRSAYPLRAEGVQPADPAPVEARTYAEALPAPVYGSNTLPLSFAESPAHAALQVTARAPDGTSETRVYSLPDNAPALAASWPVLLPGRHDVTIRLIDLDTHKPVGETVLSRDVVGLTDSFRDALDEAISVCLRAAANAPQASPAMVARCAEAESRLADVKARVAETARLSDAERRRLAKDAQTLLDSFKRLRRLAELSASEADAARQPSFVLWPDDNPWDNVDPLDTLPAQGGAPLIRAWAFGNEIESVCVNAANLSGDGLTLRIGPCTITRSGEPIQAPDAVRMHRAVWLPSRFGEVVPDVLPPLGEGALLDVAPGEAQQLWINLRTKGLDPGEYTFKWPVTALEPGAQPVELTVRLDVSRVALTEKSRYLANFWSRNQVDGLSTIPDLNDHLQTVWYMFPLPAAKCDANGELVGELDWTLHDAMLREAKQIELILYGAPPTPAFPEGVQPADELRLKAQQNYAKKMVDHLQSLGIGYDKFMFYPEDEPGLAGSIANFMRSATANKAVDPKFQNFSNPWGAVNLAKIEEMWTVSDVWQPGMDVVEQLGKPAVDAMRRGGKRVLTYTPPGNARILRPLGFFRAQPWVALYWGLDGGGWWTYYQGDDLFTVDPNKEPSYGAVNWDGRAIVPSRRWEASRDGIEDFNAVMMLRDLAKGDAAALDAIKQAVDYVGRTAITGMPREAAPYDLDYATLTRHRQAIRAALERLSP